MISSLTHARGRRGRRAAVALVTLLACAVPFLLSTGSAVAGPTYPVMNTSEYPPDGVWFRNSPNDADAIRVTGLGVYAGDRVTLDCWARGTNVARRDGGVNTVWYQASNATRPSAAGRANRGWINAHFVDDGTAAGQVAPGVPACGAAAPAPAPAPAPPTFDARGATFALVFDTSMSRFLERSNQRWNGTADEKKVRPGLLDWTTDGCSVQKYIPEVVRNNPSGFRFGDACRRHDFGYRNFKRNGGMDEGLRQRVDDQFLRDMNAVCNGYSGLLAARGVECRNGPARAYYQVVRACGEYPEPFCSGPILRQFRLIR